MIIYQIFTNLCTFIVIKILHKPLDTARYTRAVQICCYTTNHKCIQWL